MYDKRSYIINSIINEDIYFRDVEKDVCYKPEESKQGFEENIAERTKIRR